MSVLVVGLSYRSAPLELLERATLPVARCRALEAELCHGEHVAEAVVLSTCNRLEVYAEVTKFHGGVAEVGERLARATGVPIGELTDHLYVHYETAAVTHLFRVVCGLESMAVGEQQIIGQVRLALRAAQHAGSVGGVLGAVLQQALRVGKRAHSETGLDRAGRSLVEAGLDRAAAVLGPLPQLRALVVGAGSMSGLVVATLGRRGLGQVVVANRTLARAQRLAASVQGRAVGMDGLEAALVEADLVVSCTGAAGYLVEAAAAERALEVRQRRPQLYLDLALPRDVDPKVEQLSGVELVDLEALGRLLAGEEIAGDLRQVSQLVAEEVAAVMAEQRAAEVAPTVVALRAMATSVVEAELARLTARLGPVDPRVRAELEQTVRRVVDKLLHTPTVRVKELAGGPGGTAYAEALQELFGLDPQRVAAVSGQPVRAAGGEG